MVLEERVGTGPVEADRRVEALKRIGGPDHQPEEEDPDHEHREHGPAHEGVRQPVPELTGHRGRVPGQDQGP